MCIIHDINLHYLFQNILEAFENSKMLSSMFLKRVGCLLCTCKKDIYFDSRKIITIQRSLYDWFESALTDTAKPPVSIERLLCFREVVNELRNNGLVDSGTKICFMQLLNDLDSFNYSRLRAQIAPYTGNTLLVGKRRNTFLTKLIHLKFDLKLCSLKEFSDLIANIDNQAINYIQMNNQCRLIQRPSAHWKLRNLMGELDVTAEARTEKSLHNAELSLKQLANAVHYRLAKQRQAINYAPIALLQQSPPHSVPTTPYDTETDTSLSRFDSQTNSTNSTNNTTKSEQSSNISSSMLNENEEESFLNKTNTSSRGTGSTTPMTSSPLSSSASESLINRFKVMTPSTENSEKVSNSRKKKRASKKEEKKKEEKKLERDFENDLLALFKAALRKSAAENTATNQQQPQQKQQQKKKSKAKKSTSPQSESHSDTTPVKQNNKATVHNNNNNNFNLKSNVCY